MPAVGRHVRMILEAADRYRRPGRRTWTVVRSRGVCRQLTYSRGWWLDLSALSQEAAAVLLRGLLFERLVEEAVEDGRREAEHRLKERIGWAIKGVRGDLERGATHTANVALATLRTMGFDTGCRCGSGAHGDLEGPLRDCPVHGERRETGR